MSKIKVYSEVLLRIEVRNMKRERFNRLFGAGCDFFSPLLSPQRNSSCYQRRFLEFHALQTRNTLSSETYQNVAKKFKLPGYPRLKAMVKFSCARTKKKSTSMTFVSETQYASFTFFSATCSNGGDATMSSKYKSE